MESKTLRLGNETLISYGHKKQLLSDMKELGIPSRHRAELGQEGKRKAVLENRFPFSPHVNRFLFSTLLPHTPSARRRRATIHGKRLSGFQNRKGSSG